MPHRKLASSFAALLAFAAGYASAESPPNSAIHNQIKELRAERDATVKALRAQYGTLIKRDRVVESVLIKEREALARQERALLDAAISEEDRAAIRLQYDTLRGVLKGDTRLDSAVIEKLHKMERAHIKVVHSAYDGKIRELEGALKGTRAAKPKK